jgi:GntR family transcriptional regulator
LPGAGRGGRVEACPPSQDGARGIHQWGGFDTFDPYVLHHREGSAPGAGPSLRSGTPAREFSNCSLAIGGIPGGTSLPRLYAQIMPSPTGQQPLHRRIEDEIRARIAAGRWRPGTSLPSESALSGEFGVPRGIVRQALLALKAEGLLFGKPGRRPIVRSAARSRSFSSYAPFAEWARELHLDVGHRTLELADREAEAEACCALGLPAGAHVVDILRVWTVESEPAMVERSSFVLDVGRMVSEFDADRGSLLEFLADRGVLLERAHHTFDAVAASTADAQILRVAMGVPLLRERRTAVEAGGRAVGYSDERYLPAMSTFSLESSLRPRSAHPQPGG